MEVPAARRAGGRALVVLTLLVLAALLFSYLGTYAVSAALVSADVLPPWSANADPRPRWMAWVFGALVAVFLSVGGAARFLSSRQLRRIDAMAEE